ncbi:Synaptotagmin-16 [Manis pentadactyla]|nr:Synaptotagmin-16 [Manis pentadactyla]
MATGLPPEAIGFLSAVGVFIDFLVVLFLFINKKLYFETIGSLPCLEQRGKKKHSEEKNGILEGQVHTKSRVLKKLNKWTCRHQIAGMVLAMESQEALNFFQPLSSWISWIYEALQQAGDKLSASLVNISKQESKLSDKLDQDLDDIQIQETYFEDKKQGNDWSQEDTNSMVFEVDHFSCCNSYLQDSTQSSSPRIRGDVPGFLVLVSCDPFANTQKLCFYFPLHNVSSPTSIPGSQQKPWDPGLAGDVSRCTVDSFGGDEKLCTCGSDEEVVKQFEISVSWSQSFRSGASEKEKQTGLEQKSKSHCLQSTHEECRAYYEA